MTTDTQDYDISAVQELLSSAFTVPELQRFCQDWAFLRPVLNQLDPEPTVDRMVVKIIGHCWARHLLDELLQAVQVANPRQYERFASRVPERGPASPPESLPIEDIYLAQELLDTFRRVPDEWKPEVLAMVQMFVRLANFPPIRFIGDEAPEPEPEEPPDDTP